MGGFPDLRRLPFKDVTLNEDNCIHTGGFSPANWAMVRQFLVSLARQLHCRTLPEALRLMANQLQMIFDALFDHSESSFRIPMSPIV
ncbi:hypothetical protein [Nostoc sp. C110]|uniref:hypothetical protein n=1 Tax=Nostoc sp. C110 TaxID=3349876 RepID=UPI00370D8220